MFKPVYILSATRTPIGSFGGVLSSLSATQLGSIAIKESIAKSDISPDLINEVYFGNVVQANLGQAPARQAAIHAGISNIVPCTTVNKVCSSGMKSIMLGAQSIMLGINNFVVTGGMESMSNIPHYLPQLRWGKKYGNTEMVDGLAKDGLIDAYHEHAMGIFADATAAKFEISREDQDAFAIQSYKRSAEATSSGLFTSEICPVAVPQRKGDDLIVQEDEEFKKVRFEKIPQLRPAFTKDGTVTAANASTINDGASSLVLASEEAVKAHGLKPIAKIISFADFAHDPEWFTTAPAYAAPKALQAIGMTKDHVDLFEVNEAFAVVTLAFAKALELDTAKINVHGGAVSLGHPLGASGARIVTTLTHALKAKKQGIGCATLCNGGGGASALVIEHCE